MIPSDDFLRQMILDRIALGESHGYDELYGGHKFAGFGSHPGIELPGPDGKLTSAAGRYQFEQGTWNEEAKRLKLSDFSPPSQDSAAWDLAQRTYTEATGRDILDDARGGDVHWAALGGQWPSLRPKAPQVSPVAPVQEVGSWPSKPLSEVMHPVDGGQNDLAPSPNGLFATHDIMAQPLPPSKANLNPLMLMSLMAPHLQFHPVDYDPFKVEEAQREG